MSTKLKNLLEGFSYLLLIALLIGLIMLVGIANLRVLNKKLSDPIQSDDSLVFHETEVRQIIPESFDYLEQFVSAVENDEEFNVEVNGQLYPLVFSLYGGRVGEGIPPSFLYVDANSEWCIVGDEDCPTRASLIFDFDQFMVHYYNLIQRVELLESKLNSN